MEIGQQEVALQALVLPLVFKPRVLKKVNFLPRDNRWRMLKNSWELMKLEPDS